MPGLLLHTEKLSMFDPRYQQRKLDLKLVVVRKNEALRWPKLSETLAALSQQIDLEHGQIDTECATTSMDCQLGMDYKE